MPIIFIREADELTYRFSIGAEPTYLKPHEEKFFVDGGWAEWTTPQPFTGNRMRCSWLGKPSAVTAGEGAQIVVSTQVSTHADKNGLWESNGTEWCRRALLPLAQVTAMGAGGVAAVNAAGQVVNKAGSPVSGDFHNQSPIQTIIYGDSFATLSNRVLTPTSMVVSAGVCVCTLSNHGLYTGGKITIVSAADPRINLTSVPATFLTSSTFSFQCPGAPDGAVAGWSGHSAYVLDMESWNDQGGAHNAMMASGGAFSFVSNAGMSGYTSTKLRNFFASRVAAFSPKIIWRLLGYNDINAGMTVDEMLANLRADIADAAAIGAKMAVSGINPWGTAAGANTTANRIVASTYNRAASALCAQTPNVLFVDPWIKLADPSTGLAQSGMVDADGIHPTWRSMSIHAADVVAAMRAAGWIAPRRTVVSAVDSVAVDAASKQIALVGPWANTVGGTISAGTSAAIPADISSATAVAGVAANARTLVTGSATGQSWVDVGQDGTAWAQYCRVASTGANGVGTIYYGITLSYLTAGDVVDISALTSLTTSHNASNKSPSGQLVTAFWVDVVLQTADGYFSVFAGRKSSTAAPTSDITGLAVMEGIVIPAGLLSAKLQLNVQFSATGGSATIGLSHIEIRKR